MMMAPISQTKLPGHSMFPICFVAMPPPHSIFTLLHVSPFPSAVRSHQHVVDALFITLFILVSS
jgi:hypothetical protein